MIARILSQRAAVISGNGRVKLDSGVVYQDVDLAVKRPDLRRCHRNGRGLLEIDEVKCDGMCRICRAQLVCRGLSCHVVAIEDADPGACLLKVFRDRSPMPWAPPVMTAVCPARLHSVGFPALSLIWLLSHYCMDLDAASFGS